MSYPRIILIGGAPMVDKTTVAYRLAATLGYGCLSTDDLGEALRAITTKDSHPHLHPMEEYDYQEYYITHSLDTLIADVALEHQALWPAVQRVIHKHATGGTPIVMEGWSLWQSGCANYGCPVCTRSGSWHRKKPSAKGWSRPWRSMVVRQTKRR